MKEKLKEAKRIKLYGHGPQEIDEKKGKPSLRIEKLEINGSAFMATQTPY